MTIIVVEGSDGAGKTTLIEQAREGQRERYFLTVRASRYPPNLKTAFQYLQWIKHQRDFDVLLDRIHFISDRVYGPILRNEDLFKELPLDFGLREAAVIVHCRPPLGTILANVGRTKQMVGVADHTEAIVEKYDELMLSLQMRGRKIMTYDYTNDDPKAFWRYVWGEVKK
jgi:hypothetical protein